MSGDTWNNVKCFSYGSSFEKPRKITATLYLKYLFIYRIVKDF